MRRRSGMNPGEKDLSGYPRGIRSTVLRNMPVGSRTGDADAVRQLEVACNVLLSRMVGQYSCGNLEESMDVPERRER